MRGLKPFHEELVVDIVLQTHNHCPDHEGIETRRTGCRGRQRSAAWPATTAPTMRGLKLDGGVSVHGDGEVVEPTTTAPTMRGLKLHFILGHDAASNPPTTTAPTMRGLTTTDPESGRVRPDRARDESLLPGGGREIVTAGRSSSAPDRTPFPCQGGSSSRRRAAATSRRRPPAGGRAAGDEGEPGSGVGAAARRRTGRGRLRSLSATTIAAAPLPRFRRIAATGPDESVGVHDRARDRGARPLPTPGPTPPRTESRLRTESGRGGNRRSGV